MLDKEKIEWPKAPGSTQCLAFKTWLSYFDDDNRVDVFGYMSNNHSKMRGDFFAFENDENCLAKLGTTNRGR